MVTEFKGRKVTPDFLFYNDASERELVFPISEVKNSTSSNLISILILSVITLPYQLMKAFK